MDSNDSKISNYKQTHARKKVSIVHPYFTEEGRKPLNTSNYSCYRRKEACL